MASARAASLYEQRKNSFSLSDKRKVLSPSNSTYSSAARREAVSELDAMVAKYSGGMLGNDEMRSFLQKMAGNQQLTASERTDVETQLREFDDRVRRDQLESVYKSAPEDSIQRVSAAQALASYYQTKAGSMVAGTPAHSQMIEQAGQWTNQATSLQQQAATTQRRNMRYTEEAKVNQIPNNTSDRAMARADMYLKLANQAAADGDQTDYNKYASAYQQEITNAQGLSEREQEQAFKEEERGVKEGFRMQLNQLADYYHDGKINEGQYLDALNTLAPQIDATNDYGLISTVNRTADTVYKNQQKGGKKTTMAASNLPVQLKVGSAGTGSGISTTWDKADFDYSDDLRIAQQSFKKGEFTAEEYQMAVAEAVVNRAQELETRIESVYAKASANPNAKIKVNGRNQRVEDVYNTLIEEQEKVEAQAEAVESGTMGVVIVPPDEFTTTGNVKKTGKSIASFEIIDTRNMPPDQYAIDKSGIYHKIIPETMNLTPEQMADMNQVFNNTYTDPNDPTKSYFIKYDSSGNPYYETGRQKVKVYEPGTGNMKEYDYAQGDVVPSWEEAIKDAKFIGPKPMIGPQLNKLATPSAELASDVTKLPQPKPDMSAFPTLPKSNLAPTPELDAIKAAPIAPTAPIKPVAPVPISQLPGIPNTTPVSQSMPQSVQTQVRMPSIIPNVSTPMKPQPKQDALQLAAPQKSAIAQATQTKGLNLNTPQVQKATNVTGFIQQQSKPQTLADKGNALITNWWNKLTGRK